MQYDINYSAWPDPEVWVRDGFILINVDSRGAGQSPGRLDVNSPAEFRDFYDAIEWAAVQPWSTGKVALADYAPFAVFGSNRTCAACTF